MKTTIDREPDVPAFKNLYHGEVFRAIPAPDKDSGDEAPDAWKVEILRAIQSYTFSDTFKHLDLNFGKYLHRKPWDEMDFLRGVERRIYQECTGVILDAAAKWGVKFKGKRFFILDAGNAREFIGLFSDSGEFLEDFRDVHRISVMTRHIPSRTVQAEFSSREKALHLDCAAPAPPVIALEKWDFLTAGDNILHYLEASVH